VNLFESQLRILVKFLSKEKIRYAILGGVAVAVYGEPRMTADIDVNIILEKMGMIDFLKKAKRYNFYPSIPNAKQIALKNGILPMKLKKGKLNGRIDFIIAENAIEFTSIKRASMKKIGCVRAKFVGLEDLIIHKICSSRSRDLEDLKGILMRQRGKIKAGYVRIWLKKIDSANKGSHLCKLFNGLLKEA